jgi:DNA replication and repair protein RecF
MITPYDINLILEGSESRRRFFDALIAQFDKNYLFELLQYNKLLKQRNAFLKTNTSQLIC